GLTANDGQPVETVVTGATNSVLDGFTVRGGRGTNGAGMVNEAASPIVANCRFVDNQATQYGGAILNNPGSYPLIENCGFTANAAGISGGAIANNGAVPEIRNCTFRLNMSGTTGGAIVNTPGSSAIIENCVFERNSTGTGGGAVHSQQASPLIGACVFTGNKARDFGGAAFNDSATPFFVNCLFAGNECEGSGGAVANVTADPTFLNCTVADNFARKDGGAVYNNQSDPALVNCIVWENDPDEFYNVKSRPSVRYSDVFGGHQGAGNFSIDPRFVNPANGNYRLQPQSWCINAGTNSGAPETDLEGVSRPQGIGVDVGAYEATEIGEREPLTLCGALLRAKDDSTRADGSMVLLPGVAVLLVLTSWRRQGHARG
ncbi:MAG TPA: right-handed parallel beta-helix repeat-containing protein, partial [Candidatus Hydrogenedentes bacterium]|nr:right-handed parallel beta-helix repeat-containing protein [Candidatus Hydrogenedentota bacterium]